MSMTMEEHLDFLREQLRNNVTKVEELIKDNPAISFAELFESIPYSQRHFSEAFKNKTGINLVAYRQRARIDRARKLLVESDLDLESICEAIGYTSVESFIKIFRSFNGCSPLLYRTRMQKLKESN